MRKQKGFTAVELMIILGVLLILGAIAQSKINNSSSTETYSFQAQQDVVLRGLIDWGAGRPFTGVSMAVLCADGYIDDTSVCGASNDGTGANPWGGDIQVSVNSSSVNRADIRWTQVPTQVGPKVARAYQGRARASQYDSGTKVAIFVFGT